MQPHCWTRYLSDRPSAELACHLGHSSRSSPLPAAGPITVLIDHHLAGALPAIVERHRIVRVAGIGIGKHPLITIDQITGALTDSPWFVAGVGIFKIQQPNKQTLTLDT